MSARRLAGSAALATVLAACTTGSAPAPAAAVPEPALLTYTYAVGDAPVYDLSSRQHVVVSADGDPGALAEDLEVPFTADVTTSASTELSYTVADGPREGTYEISLHAAFPDVAVEGTVNGEPIEEGSTTDLGTMEPIDATVVVDEQGRILSEEGEPLDLGGLLDEFGGEGGLVPGATNRPFGPAFPEDRPLTVGDSWTEEESRTLPDGTTVTATTVHEVVAAEELDGIPVLVIESTTTTGEATVDVGALLGDLVAGFPEGEDAAAATPDLRVALAPSTKVARTWFDPEAGTVRRAETSSSAVIRMEAIVPGDSTSLTMEMRLDTESTADLRGESVTS